MMARLTTFRAGARRRPARFDPAQHTVAEVQAYIGAHPDQADQIIAAERTGKARASLIGD